MAHTAGYCRRALLEAWAVLLPTALVLLTPLWAASPSPEQVEFFESQVWPLLATNCYQCHSAKAKPLFAQLQLDSRAGVLKGGNTGPAVIPGDPGQSKLIHAVEGKTLQMPPTGKLKDAEIAALVKWVEMGAPWPDDQAPAPVPSAAAFDLEGRKNGHWVWQPVRATPPPDVRNRDWPLGAVDRFVLRKLEDNDLAPADPANRYTLLRRLSFDLRGLPPTPEEIEAFVNDDSSQAYESVVDRLIESPRFGEHWARHWMDLVRYSESHGSEGDPDVPEAWRYRDYLIRALNHDVPYDQLIREHLAGDLLPSPRWSADGKTNESILGPAHFRMIEHAYDPVEPWEDRVKWIDNQIDVFSKAFQGLTVSCARCHDHKFDAISQKDFYALFGSFVGARPIQTVIDDPAYLRLHSDDLATLKTKIRDRLADFWLDAAGKIELRLIHEQDAATRKALEQAHCDEAGPLYVWELLREKDGKALQTRWAQLAAHRRSQLEARRRFNEEHFEAAWDLAGADYATWLKHGIGLPEAPSKPGEFFIQPDGDRVVSGIYPSGVYTHLLTPKHGGVLQSPRFKIERDYISVRTLGGNYPIARLVVENYVVPRGGIFNHFATPHSDQREWFTWDVTYWKGFTGYIEFATRDDMTRKRLDRRKSPRPAAKDDGRSYFGADRIYFHDGHESPQDLVDPALYLLDGDAPTSKADLARRVGERIAEAVEAWRAGRLTAEQAAFLDYFVRHDLLPTSLGQLIELQPLVAEFRTIEAQVPVARRAPGLLDESAPAQPLLIRGSHNSPGDPVPRRFLTALGSEHLGDDPRMVRLHLAEAVTDPDNPLTSRVMVNRIWRLMFGQGIVRTVDNLGKLGERPSHPELLDHLADQFVQQGWSIKKMVRLLATSRAYRMSSTTSAKSKQTDPENKLVQHANIRRLEAEAIRDSVLAAAGELNTDMYGPSVKTYYEHDSGKSKGDKAKGPLDGDGRRSVYLEVRRNVTNPFLDVFDVPKPSTTRGQRDVTNVPAQSLTMMNSPFVIEQAAKWSRHLVAKGPADEQGKLRHIFLRTLGRVPTAEEQKRAGGFLLVLAKEHGVPQNEIQANPRVWQDLAQAVFNFKEFIYIQ